MSFVLIDEIQTHSCQRLWLIGLCETRNSWPYTTQRRGRRFRKRINKKIKTSSRASFFVCTFSMQRHRAGSRIKARNAGYLLPLDRSSLCERRWEVTILKWLNGKRRDSSGNQTFSRKYAKRGRNIILLTRESFARHAVRISGEVTCWT